MRRGSRKLHAPVISKGGRPAKLDAATRELLRIPGLLADVRKAHREIAAGKGVPWRKVLKERSR